MFEGKKDVIGSQELKKDRKCNYKRLKTNNSRLNNKRETKFAWVNIKSCTSCTQMADRRSNLDLGLPAYNTESLTEDHNESHV